MRKLVFTCLLALATVSCGNTSGESGSATGLNNTAALLLCKNAFRSIAKDPEKAEIPYVQNFGSGDEYYFAWGNQTKMMRMRNGLGLEVATTGSCIVSKSAKKITSLTLDGKTVL